MRNSSLTPQEYESHLEDLRHRLRAYLERGEGAPRQLLHDAESVLELADEFPEILKRNEDVQGLVAELLARWQQEKFLAHPCAPRETPGCLLGWLLASKGKNRERRS